MPSKIVSIDSKSSIPGLSFQLAGSSQNSGYKSIFASSSAVPDLIQFCGVAPSASGTPVNHILDESANSMLEVNNFGLYV